VSPLHGCFRMIYLAHARTRKSFGLMTRKLSVTESQNSGQHLGTFSVSCSNRHHRLTGIMISPRVFVLCSLWRGFHVPAFPPVGGGAVAQHRQSRADVRPRRRECFRAPALANDRRQAGVSGLRLHDLPRLSSRSLSALAMQGVRLRFLGDFGHAVRLA